SDGQDDGPLSTLGAVISQTHASPPLGPLRRHTLAPIWPSSDEIPAHGLPVAYIAKALSHSSRQIHHFVFQKSANIAPRVSPDRPFRLAFFLALFHHLSVPREKS